MRRAAVALTLASALVIAALAVGAWELRRLNSDVQALRTARTDDQLDGAIKSLAALTRQTAKLRESGIRQEFSAPLYAYLVHLAVAVYSNNIDCRAAKQRWQNYVNNRLIPYLNDPDNRAVKTAVRNDDPDYHATLLDAFTVDCSAAD